MRTIYSNLILH